MSGWVGRLMVRAIWNPESIDLNIQAGRGVDYQPQKIDPNRVPVVRRTSVLLNRCLNGDGQIGSQRCQNRNHLASA